MKNQEIKPYMFVKEHFDWYYYLTIHGGTGSKNGLGGQYAFNLAYLTPWQQEEVNCALDIWCKDRGIPCGVGDSIEEAHNDFQHQLIRLPLK